MYLILAQIHSRIFNLEHWIRRKINTLKKEKARFKTNMKLCNMKFEKIQIWEWVSQSQESHHLAKFVGLKYFWFIT